jgi:hypothetical protein
MKAGLNRAAVLMIAVVLAGCADTTAVEFAAQPELAILQMEGYPGPAPVWEERRDTSVVWTVSPGASVVVAEIVTDPAVVQAGQPFVARVTTIGESGCWQAAGQDVRHDGRTVELTPYDTHSGSDLCTTILPGLVHESTLTFESPGEWKIRVSGRIARYDDRTWQSPVSVEKTITVR